MASPKLLSSPLRPTLLPQSPSHVRHASLLRRPKRPYTFTQLITLSDGSTFTHRTTSPQPVYRSIKDTRNAVLWNPSSQKLLNIEEDEAGRLRRFRLRFGRGFDAEGGEEGNEASQADQASGDQQDQVQRQPEASLMDLITGYSQGAAAQGSGGGAKEAAKKSGKGKGGGKK